MPTAAAPQVDTTSPLPFFGRETATADEAMSLPSGGAGQVSEADQDGDLTSDPSTDADSTGGRSHSVSAAEVEGLREAALLVVETGAASVPLLVKRLGLDQAQARWQVEVLEEAGIVLLGRAARGPAQWSPTKSRPSACSTSTSAGRTRSASIVTAGAT